MIVKQRTMMRQEHSRYLWVAGLMMLTSCSPPSLLITMVPSQRNLVETELSHLPAGINVLHLDGSVNFVRYSPLNNSSNFPATLLAAETFGADVPQLSMDCY